MKLWSIGLDFDYLEILLFFDYCVESFRMRPRRKYLGDFIGVYDEGEGVRQRRLELSEGRFFSIRMLLLDAMLFLLLIKLA